MEQIVVGMAVVDADGPIGRLASVHYDEDGAITNVVVQRRSSNGVFTPQEYVVVDSVLWLDGDGSMTASDVAGTDPNTADGSQRIETVDLTPGEELRIPVLRETAVIQIRQVQRGGVRVHKTVRSHEEQIDLPLVREDVTVERMRIDQVVDAAPQSRQEGDTLILPIVEERTFVGTHLVLVEEVRITRHRTQTTQEVSVELREEHVEIETLDDKRTV